MDTLGKILHVNFLGYAYGFMSIIISQLKYHSVSLDQDIYVKSVVAKYLVTSKIRKKSKFYKTTLPHDVISLRKIILPSMNKWK